MPPTRLLPDSLVRELRSEPFRPILVEDIIARNPRAEPESVHISKDGFRTLYRHALTFTKNGASSFTPFEVGFFLEKDGSVRTYEEFRAYHSVMEMLLENGLSGFHAEACKAWEDKSKGRFDPNLQDSIIEHGWGLLIAPPEHIEAMLSVEQILTLGYLGAMPFIYLDGFAACAAVPGKEGALHTHTITHSDPEAYLPSDHDDADPAVWLVLDIPFINARLADAALSAEEKISGIIEHHTEGMALAVCVGTCLDENGLKVLVNK